MAAATSARSRDYYHVIFFSRKVRVVSVAVAVAVVVVVAPVVVALHLPLRTRPSAALAATKHIYYILLT